MTAIIYYWWDDNGNKQIIPNKFVIPTGAKSQSYRQHAPAEARSVHFKGYDTLPNLNYKNKNAR